MAIVASDIKLKLSVTSGSAGNTTAGTIAGSLGKYISTTEITDNTLNNLFDDVSGDDNANSVSDYRCVFVHNSHASLQYQNPYVWLTNKTAAATVVSIAIDTTVASALGASGAQALLVANELTAPAGLTFTTPVTKGAGLALGSLNAGQVRAIWIKRTAANTAALNNDTVTLNVEGDTAS